MSRFICKITEEDKIWYLEWSTIVDAPVTYGMSLEKFKEFYQAEYGRSSLSELATRLERVEAKGTSSFMHDSAEDVMDWNRAGKDGSSLSRQQLIDVYCTRIIAEKERPMGTFPDD
jgi:hypothetical protein